MPHTLDGYPVILGDLVHAVGLGQGVVVELLLENRFRVEFVTSARIVTFDSLGVMARADHRALFWHDPILVAPLKGEFNWTRMLPVARAMIEAYRASPPAISAATLGTPS